ncbi:MAG: transcriptional regulator [Rhodobacteraceae bacterium]|nr:MAG: transcriptional regulator [Paracoccaceae bacterium]
MEPTWVSARAVRQRYGGEQPISDMTLHRWLNNPAMNFPRPTYFGRFRFWRLDEIEAWERDRPRGRTLADAETEAAA